MGKTDYWPVQGKAEQGNHIFVFFFYLPDKLLLQISAVVMISLGAILFSSSFVSAADTETPTGSIQRDQALIITAKEILGKIKQNTNILLVDVRSPEEFDRARIPNSLNISLHAVKSKLFLKPLNFILINAGGDYRSLEEEATKLKLLGFSHLRVLAGGMSAWQDAGERVDGDSDVKSRLNEISPRDFQRDSSYDDWILIDTSSIKFIDTDSVLSQASYIPLEENQDNFVNQIDSALTAKNDIPAPFILIFNENGDYGHIKYALRNVELTNVFYLRGGIAAYRDFLEKQVMMLNPGGKKSTQCDTCPQ